MLTSTHARTHTYTQTHTQHTLTERAQKNYHFVLFSSPEPKAQVSFFDQRARTTNGKIGPVDLPKNENDRVCLKEC